MRKRNLGDQLDDAVDSIMTVRPTPQEPLSPRLTGLLEIAAALQDLPRDEFKARLGADLAKSAGMRAGRHAGKIVAPVDRAAMISHDVASALRDLPEMSMRFLASMDQYTIGVSRLSAPSHWERHPAGDEMLHILAGEVDITTLTDDGPVTVSASAGSLFICRSGLWHRLSPRSPLSVLFATPGEGTEISAARDPRRKGDGARSTTRPSGHGPQPTETAREIRVAPGDLPRLEISPTTTGAEAAAAVHGLATVDQHNIGLMCFSGQTPWERHPDGDELLHVLDGAVDVTVLMANGEEVRETVSAGSIFICPRGLWHRQVSQGSVTEIFATPTQTTEISWADLPLS